MSITRIHEIETDIDSLYLDGLNEGDILQSIDGKIAGISKDSLLSTVTDDISDISTTVNNNTSSINSNTGTISNHTGTISNHTGTISNHTGSINTLISKTSPLSYNSTNEVLYCSKPFTIQSAVQGIGFDGGTQGYSSLNHVYGLRFRNPDHSIAAYYTENDGFRTSGDCYIDGTINIGTTNGTVNLVEYIDGYAASILANTNKVGITTQEKINIVNNTAKVGITPAQTTNIGINTLKVGITTTQRDDISDNNNKTGITSAQANDITSNNSKDGISWVQSLAILANSAKIGISPSEQSAISTNSGKVGITGAQATAISDNSGKTGITGAQTTAISTNSGKTGITSSQTTAISTNSGKVGITSAQATAISDNSLKDGITSAQATAISDNSLKDGITSAQATAISDNSLKDGITGAQATAISTNSGKVGITGAQATAISTNSLKDGITGAQVTAISTNSGKVGITGAQATAISTNSGKTGITGAQATAISTNSGKVGITGAQATAISTNSGKVGITGAQVTAISTNSGKVGITGAQATAISTNSGKVGITTTQATAISDNTAKTGISSSQVTAISNNTAKIGISSSQSGSIINNTNKVGISITQAGEIVNNSNVLSNLYYTDTTNYIRPTQVLKCSYNTIQYDSLILLQETDSYGFNLKYDGVSNEFSINTKRNEVVTNCFTIARNTGIIKFPVLDEGILYLNSDKELVNSTVSNDDLIYINDNFANLNALLTVKTVPNGSIGGFSFIESDLFGMNILYNASNNHLDITRRESGIDFTIMRFNRGDGKILIGPNLDIDLVENIENSLHFSERQFSYNPSLKNTVYQYLFTMENTDSPVEVEFRKHYLVSVDYDTSIKYKFTVNENWDTNPIYCVEVLNSNHDNDLGYTRIKEFKSFYAYGKYRIFFRDQSTKNHTYQYNVKILNNYSDEHYFETNIGDISHLHASSRPVQFYSYQDEIKGNTYAISTNTAGISTNTATITGISYDSATDITHIDNNLSVERLMINPPANNKALYSSSLSKDWIYLYHNTYNGAVGGQSPQPECGIAFTNVSSSNLLTWHQYIGVVKDTASASSSSMRMDFGIAHYIETPESTATPGEQFNPRMTIRSGGQVGIGVIPTANESYKLRVGGSAVVDGSLQCDNHATIGGNLTVGNNLVLSNSSQIRLPSTNNFVVIDRVYWRNDDFNPANNPLYYTGRYNDTFAVNFQRNILVNGSTVFYSDKRIKDSITPNKYPSLDIINAIEIYQYKYTKRNQPLTTGFIAQQLQKVDEEYNTDFVEIQASVEEYPDLENVLTVKKDKLYPHLVGAIKDLSCQVKSLEDEIIKLKLQNAEILSTSNLALNERLTIMEKRFAEVDISKYFT